MKKTAAGPLAEVAAGKRIRMVEAEAGRGLQARLASMGLLPGVELKMIRNPFRGPLIVSVKGTQLMLGRGVARKIMVRSQ